MRDKLWVLALAVVGIGVVVSFDLTADKPEPATEDVDPADEPRSSPALSETQEPAEGDAVPAHVPVVDGAVDPESDAPVVENTALDKHVSFAFSGASLIEVVGYIAEVTGANIVLSPSARESAETVPISLTLTDVSAHTALETMTRIAGLSIDDEGGIVYLDTQRAKPARGNPPVARADSEKADSVEAPPLSETLRTRLATRTSVNFDETAPADALKFLSLLMGSPNAGVVLMPSAAEFVGNATVTFQLDDVSIGNILRILARQLDLELEYDGDVVLLTKPASPR